MALDPVPWFIGGGAEHSAGTARLLVHIATGGAAGIVSSPDLFVTQKPAPTDLITIAPGAAIIPNTNAVQQSYALRAPSATDLDITPTGSVSGRSDLVVAYVDDPEFTGQVLPEDEVQFGPYVKFALIEGVSPTQTTVPETFDYPAIALARITMPVNTAAVTQAMITDLRKVAMPKRTRDLYNTQPTATSSVASTGFVDWIPQCQRNITIPAWATQIKVVGTIAGAKSTTVGTVGNVAWTLGTLGSQATAFDFDPNSRSVCMTADTVSIPANLRGTTQTLKLRGSRASGTGNLVSDALSTVLWDVEFLEVASAD